MKVIALSMMGVVGLAACGVADPESTGEVNQEIVYHNDIFYENFNSLHEGSIDGQNGWVGGAGESGPCFVVADSNTDKNLACSYDGSQNGEMARHSFVTPANRNYHFQFDAWTRGVTDGIHGKVFLEAPPGDGSGAIFQIAIGCYQQRSFINATFEYSGPSQQLLTDKDCNGHYRVACIWRDQGRELRCGASRLADDPQEADFKIINTPEPIHSFNLVRLLGGIGRRQGTTTYDKVQVLSD